jgi:hypothetical protein
MLMKVATYTKKKHKRDEGDEGDEVAIKFLTERVQLYLRNTI